MRVLGKQKDISGNTQHGAGQDIIAPPSATQPRQGWEEQFQRTARLGDDCLLDGENLMSVSNLNSSSKTNWERLDAMTDEEIDMSDSPPLTEEFFARAVWMMPGEPSPHPSVKIELALDPSLLAWFQAQGQDHGQRMQAALRLYAQAHQAVG